MPTKSARILYWVFTLLFLIPQTWSAVQMITEAPRMTATITELGYPIYFMKILATFKLLGAAAILYGRFPTLKEWAYAGFTLEVIGAFFSHVASRDALVVAAVPVLFLGAQLGSYFLWKLLEGERRTPAGTSERPARPPRVAMGGI